MTDREKKILEDTKRLISDAKVALAAAQDSMQEAAEACKGMPMEDRLNSFWDALEDMRFDLGKQIRAFEKRVTTGEGSEAPESWKEAI